MKTFKIAVAGCGSMAHTWVRYALSRVDTSIVALADIAPKAARAMAEKYGIQCGIYDNIGEAARASGANLVFDVTIPASHSTVVSAATAAGCDVMGEKPMASSMEEARDMVETVTRSGRFYAVMQNRRYLRNIRALWNLVASGAIGQPGYLGADFFLGPHFGGFRDIMDSPLILDMAIHTFDQARFIIGADPVSVYCHEYNPSESWYAGNAAAVCIFEFSRGITFCYRGSWCAQGCPTSWESSWRVTGSRGTALWDGEQAPYAEVVAAGVDKKFIYDTERVEAPFTWIGREGHEGCLDEMFSALIENRKAETDCADNIKSVAMVFAAIESARRGVKVPIIL